MRTNPSLAIYHSRRLCSECLAVAFEASGAFARVDSFWSWPHLTEVMGQSPPDVLLLEVEEDGADPLARLDSLTAGFPHLEIVVLGSRASDEVAAAYVVAGAKACVSADTRLRHLIELVVSVARGEAPCSPRLAFQVFTMVAAMARSRSELSMLESTSLTMRQIEVLKLLGQDLSDREIAEHLGVSLHTVKNHVQRIFEKLRVRSRTEALRVALAGGPSGLG